MISEVYKVPGLGRRLREQEEPTEGAKKINRELYDARAIPAGVAPTVTDDPVIAGDAEVGATLTCTPGTYAGTPAPTVTRQWRRNTTDLGGETGLTYLVDDTDAGQSITCRETATNTAGSVSSTSNEIEIA